MSALVVTPRGMAGVASAARASRRASTRRAVVLPCQVVRERGFRLIADRTLDVSASGMLVPLGAAVDGGEPVIASFEIPGTWIDVEAVVTRVVHGRRPYDDVPAVGIAFKGLSASSRAALAGFLHGRPPPLPRRGPLARLRRGAELPQLADAAIMGGRLLPRPVLALALDEHEELDARVEDETVVHLLDDADVIDDAEAPAEFGLGVLLEIAAAWRRLGEEG